jgi:hypothetical protein
VDHPVPQAAPQGPTCSLGANIISRLAAGVRMQCQHVTFREAAAASGSLPLNEQHGQGGNDSYCVAQWAMSARQQTRATHSAVG